MYRKIVVGYDGTDGGRDLLALAAALRGTVRAPGFGLEACVCQGEVAPRHG